MQRCPSGLRSTIGNRVQVNRLPEVQILFSAPTKAHPLLWVCFFVEVEMSLPKLRIIGGSRERSRTTFLTFRIAVGGATLCCLQQYIFSAPTKKRQTKFYLFFVCIPNLEEDLRVGAVLREQNALPNSSNYTKKKNTAKDAIKNGGAGRAAKGANPLLCATIT